MVETREAVEVSCHDMSVLLSLLSFLCACGIPKTILNPDVLDFLLSRQLLHQRLDGLETSVKRTGIYDVDWRL